MDTLSPQSVLDHRQNIESSVIPDKITRSKSPRRPLSVTFNPEIYQEDIINRVPQPYRTSFSAVTTLERRDRSRSTSPASTLSSLKSIRSRSKSPVTRKLSPKHVTYDSVVTVRRSNSYEVQQLSGEDKNEMANNNEDYQSKIREMSEMIVKEYSSPEKENVDDLFISDPPKKTHDGIQNGAPNGRLPKSKQRSPPKQVLSKDYDHDRTISYRKAIHDQYSNEIKTLADNVVDERYASEPQNIGMRVERSNSVPSRDETQNNKLTPNKRTISGSISNFFRRMSPRMSRKQRKEKGSKTSLSSQQSRESETGSNQRFSRSKVRQSFLNLLKRPKSRSSSTAKDDQKQPQDDTDGGFRTDRASDRILKSIEQNNMSEREVYNRFKGKHTDSDKHPGDTTQNGRPQAMKATHPTPNIEIRVDSPPGSENRDPVQKYREPISRNNETKQKSPPNSQPSTSRDHSSRQAEPPNSLGVHMVPKSGNTLQRTLVSSMSADESIGDCSLDFTGSDPSILTEGSQETTTPSKVVFSSTQENLSEAFPKAHRQVLGRKDQSLSESALNPVSNKIPSIHLTKHNVEFTDMPKLADSAEIVLPEYTKTPSYLRLSCSVSGYGRYSQYSSYKVKKDTRSPYSSTSSLRSDPLSPEMAKVVSPVQRTSVGSNSEFGLIRPQPLVYNRSNRTVTNGISSNLINGHSLMDGTQYPTGDTKLDGEYYLNVTRTEENRLMSLCRQMEADLYCQDIPEDASGKIRAAIGKANLLVNQKFKQFEDLCYEHMNPSVDGKLLKWQDLQGFWDMIKIQVDNVEEMFTELELIRQNGWKELCMHSRESSVSSSPKSGSVNLSNASTPAGTPGSKRRVSKTKETPESSPERTERMKLAARARDDARKKMMAEKRAAMKKKQQDSPQDVEIFVADK